MRHVDIAVYGMAAAVLIVLILLAPFGTTPKCFKNAVSSVFCKVQP
jgi:hypothetical protein